MKARFWCMALVGGLLGFVPSAHAIPTLQVYVEGAVYDEATETWIGTPDINGLLHVWAIGSDDGLGGGSGDLVGLKIVQLRMAIIFAGGIGSGEGNDADGLDIVLVAADTTFGGFFDSWPGGGSDVGDIMPRTADIVTGAGSQGDTVLIGGPPVGAYVPIINTLNLATGSDELASHGEFVPGLLWQEYNLPDMDLLGVNLVDIADFAGIAGSDQIPSPDANKSGILYAFTIDATQFLPGIDWHFDLYGLSSTTTEVCRGNPNTCTPVQSTGFKIEFAPFSHDGGGVERKIPEPLMLALFGAGLIGLGVLRRRIVG